MTQQYPVRTPNIGPGYIPDFFLHDLHIILSDGSELTFKNAGFTLNDKDDDNAIVEVYTEHGGYHGFATNSIDYMAISKATRVLAQIGNLTIEDGIDQPELWEFRQLMRVQPWYMDNFHV